MVERFVVVGFYLVVNVVVCDFGYGYSVRALFHKAVVFQHREKKFAPGLAEAQHHDVDFGFGSYQPGIGIELLTRHELGEWVFAAEVHRDELVLVYVMYAAARGFLVIEESRFVLRLAENVGAESALLVYREAVESGAYYHIGDLVAICEVFGVVAEVDDNADRPISERAEKPRERRGHGLAFHSRYSDSLDVGEVARVVGNLVDKQNHVLFLAHRADNRAVGGVVARDNVGFFRELRNSESTR